jgi:ABC-type sugar transport system ATPase subunit/ribose/xylose/arabinose/galactoside ABC-type transport system permease subunit
MLEIHGLTKHYPGVRALHDVSLHLAPGSIHALVGENGAGKSTLIKILAGVIRADGGCIQRDNQTIYIGSPMAARHLGIGVLHQHTHLIPDLSVAENDALRRGYALGQLKHIEWSRVRAQTAEALRDLAPNVSVDLSADRLGGIEKQLVELACVLVARPSVLILDEPTAILPQRETDLLFDRVQAFAAQGGAVLFITHRLNEVFRIAQSVTVLRDGEHIWTKPIDATDSDDLIRAMVGRSVMFKRDSVSPSVPAPDLLQVAHLTDASNAFCDISFSLARGEIYGLYGLVGAGQPELCQGLFGLRQTTAGRVVIDGNAITHMSPEDRVQTGLGYVPAERMGQGMFYDFSVGQNLSIANLPALSGWGRIHLALEQSENQSVIERLQIRAQTQEQKVAELSGGNQQKVLLGRWLQTQPAVLILEEPTQGVDVGAKGEIYDHIRRLSKSGVTLLVVSSEILELRTIAHRIGILCQGRLVAQVDADTATEADLLRYALPDPQTAKLKAQESVAPSTLNRIFSAFLGRREAGLAFFVLCLCIMATWLAPAFASWENLRDILVNNTILFIGALGVGLVIIAGAIDISIGALLGLAAVMAGLTDQSGGGPTLIAGAALLTGGLLGLFNGLLSVYGRVHAIVITLGTMSLFRGAIIQITGGKWLLNLSPGITFWDTTLFGIPTLLFIGLAVALGAHIFLTYTRPGRRLYVIGSNADYAGYLGITPRQVLPLAFGLCGLLLGLAGLIQAARYGQVQTNVGTGFELKAIAAAVIGGTHIMGGRGSVLGIFLGALLIGLLANILVLMHISAFWEGVFVGLVILLTVLVDTTLSHRRSA